MLDATLCFQPLLHSLKRAILLCLCPSFHATPVVHSHGKSWTQFYIECVDSVCDILTLLKIWEPEAPSSEHGGTSHAGACWLRMKGLPRLFAGFPENQGNGSRVEMFKIIFIADLNLFWRTLILKMYLIIPTHTALRWVGTISPFLYRSIIKFPGLTNS